MGSSGSWGDAAGLRRGWLVLRAVGVRYVLGAWYGLRVPPADRWPASGQLFRNRIAGVAQCTVGTHVEHARRMVVQFAFGVVGVGADDQAMAHVSLVGGRAVDGDDAR